MSSKQKIIVIIACLISFVCGMTVAPIYNLIKKVNLACITDSVFVYDKAENIGRPGITSDGYHTWISPKGNLYMGVWKNGNLSNGTLITDKGVYEGSFLNLSPHGYGVMYYNNGDVYRGNWSVGNKEGIGLKHNRDGRMYFGHWRAGLLSTPQDVKCRVGERVYGVDLSKYQPHHSVKWDNLALFSDVYGDVYARAPQSRDYMQPVTFAFIKATQGGLQDPSYRHHLENARKHNVIVGSYHFFTIKDDIDEQISNFINNGQYVKGDLPPVLDLESEYPDQKKYVEELRMYGVGRMQEEALKWLEAIEAHFKVKPIIYTTEIWKRDFLANDRLATYKFWISHYYNEEPQREKNWIFWQRTDQAILNGYGKNIDVDMYRGSFDDFMKYRKSVSAVPSEINDEKNSFNDI